MQIFNSVTDLIGATPLLNAKGYKSQHNLQSDILVKLEYLNPSGSVKDRLAKAMIEDAEQQGKLHAGSTIIEATSGNTGIGLASIAATRGYRCILTMPETMSVERRNILKAYGADIVLTDGSKGMKGAIARAAELEKEIPNSLVLSQFNNPINAKTHEATTGREIWNDTEGKVDILVAGVGTGGTISGVGAFLKKMNPSIQIIAVEPSDSPMLSQGKAGAHKIQGIGAGFIPATLDTSSYDEVITVGIDESILATRQLAQSDGILTGISSGAALCAATIVAQRAENAGKCIVVILPDSADRYYSTALFN